MFIIILNLNFLSWPTGCKALLKQAKPLLHGTSLSRFCSSSRERFMLMYSQARAARSGTPVPLKLFSVPSEEVSQTCWETRSSTTAQFNAETLAVYWPPCRITSGMLTAFHRRSGKTLSQVCLRCIICLTSVFHLVVFFFFLVFNSTAGEA